MVMIFIFIYGCTWVSTGFAYAAEVQPTKIRAQGMALGMFSSFAWVIIYGQVTPIAYTAVKWKFLFLWIGFNLFFLPIIYFFCKEVRPERSSLPSVAKRLTRNRPRALPWKK